MKVECNFCVVSPERCVKEQSARDKNKTTLIPTCKETANSLLFVCRWAYWI